MGIEGVGQVGYSSNVSAASSTPQVKTENFEAPEVSAASQAASDVPKQQTVANTKPKSDDSDSKSMAEEARDDRIKKAISEINKKATDSEAVFGIHEKTNRVTIKIVDKKTKDVIKELPAEKTLDLIAKAWELAGLMVDEKR